MNHFFTFSWFEVKQTAFFCVCCELENFAFLSYLFTSENNLALIISADCGVVFNVLVNILPEPWSLYKYTQLSCL